MDDSLSYLLPAVQPSRPAPSREKLYDLNFMLASLVALLGSFSGSLLFHFSRMVKFLGGDDLLVGWVIGLPALLVMPLWPYIGVLQDRFGIRRLWALGLALSGTSMLVWGAWPMLGWPVYAARVVMAIGFAMILTGVSAYAAAVAPLARRGEAIGSMGIGGFIGALVGPVVGDFLLGPQAGRTLIGFQCVIWTAGGMCLAGAALAATLRREPHVDHQLSLNLFLWPWAILRLYWPGWLILPCLAFGVSMLASSTFIPLLADQRHLTSVAWYYVSYPLMGLTVRIVGRRWGEVFGVPAMTAVGVGFFVLAWLSIPVAVGNQSWNLLWPGIFGGLAHGILFPNALYLVISRLPEASRGLGVSLGMGLIESTPLFGAPILGWMAQNVGYSAAFITLAGLVLLFGVPGLLIAFRRERRSAGGTETPSQ